MSIHQQITSVQNARIKRAVKLRERRGRRQQQRTIVDGLRETRQAIASSWPIVELFCQRTTYESPDMQPLIHAAHERGAEILLVDDSVFAKLAFGERAESVAAVLETPELKLDALKLTEKALLCVLDQIEKPGNIGAVLRTLDGVGADALILSDPIADVFNPNAIRASLGAVFRVPIAIGSAPDVADWLRARQIQILAARVEGAQNYAAADYRSPTAVVMGSEARGLGERWSEADVQPIAIPMHGEVDSLNVSASAAVMLYEARRQRDN